jgi:hypothetical protein
VVPGLILIRVRDFPSSIMFRLDVGITQLETVSSGLKCLVCEDYWSCTSSPLCILMACTGLSSLYLRKICCSLKFEAQALISVSNSGNINLLSFCLVKFVAVEVELTVVLQ